MIKPKREKKGKKAKQQAANQAATEQITETLLQDPNLIQKPKLADILPWRLACLTIGTIHSLPATYRSVLEYWRARRKAKEEEEKELDEGDEEGEESSRRKEQGPREKQRLDPAMLDYDRSASAPVTMTTAGEATRMNGGLGASGAVDSDKTKVSYTLVMYLMLTIRDF